MIDAARETRATYDTIAHQYAVRAVGYPQQVEDVAWFRDASGVNGLVVDVGCGPGHHVAALRKAGLRAFGLDLSIGQLRTGGRSGVVQADMRSLPLRTASLDGVWSQAALLHLPTGLVPSALAELGRVVVPGGALLLTVAEGEGEGYEPATMYGSDRRRWFTYHSESGMRGMLAAAGFEICDVVRRTRGREWLQLRATRRQTSPGSTTGQG